MGCGTEEDHGQIHSHRKIPRVYRGQSLTLADLEEREKEHTPGVQLSQLNQLWPSTPGQAELSFLL